MSAFEFAFSLFGLLLGFTLVEVLRGTADLLKARHKARIGLLTPLLSLFVMLDVLSFWTDIWQLRDNIPVSYGALVFELLICGMYYTAASLIFPDDPAIADYDHHYFRNRRAVLGLIWLCNTLTSGAIMIMRHKLVPASILALYGLYFLFVLAAAASRNRAVNIAALAGLSGIYIYFAMA